MGRPAAWVAFELALDDERRYVGAGAGDAPWLRLSPTPGSDLATFLQAGASPDWTWIPRATKLTRIEAKAVCHARIQALRKAGYRVVRDAKRVVAFPTVRPIERRWPDGRVERFASVRAAAQIVGLGRNRVSRLIGKSGCSGCEATWHDAAT
jgi:hypothetical protein